MKLEVEGLLSNEVSSSEKNEKKKFKDQSKEKQKVTPCDLCRFLQQTCYSHSDGKYFVSLFDSNSLNGSIQLIFNLLEKPNFGVQILERTRGKKKKTHNRRFILVIKFFASIP